MNRPREKIAVKTLWYPVIFVILISAGVVDAQVRPVQGGRALDANYLIGGRGLNSIRYNSHRFDSNLYVTGQVGGGFHFRGRQPYAGSDQLRIDLPSSGMDDFRRGSTGMQQVLSGVSYGPNRYLSTGRTALTAGEIAEGMNAPGTSIPRAAYLPPMSAKRLYDSAINAYQPAAPDVGQRLTYNPLIQPARIGTPIQGFVGVSDQRSDSGAVRPAASALFGIIRKSDQQNLVDELTEAELARRAGRIESRVESRIQPTPSETEPKKTDEETAPDSKLARPKTPPSGQDVFIDILLMMEKMRAEDQERASHPSQQEKPGIEKKRSRPDQTDDPDADDEGLTVPDKQPEDAAVRQVADKIVLARLAGSNRDLFNINMSRAEKKLSEGEYYAAAGYYDIAGMLNRGNPLAPLGAALTLFAAGEPFSAALRLRQAIDRFPPMMETRVDTKAILGWQVVELRIGRLEKRLADKDEPTEPSLVFLAAFIRASMDQPDQAVKHAQTLAKIAGKEDKTYILYAKHLLKTAPTTTQPAKAGR